MFISRALHFVRITCVIFLAAGPTRTEAQLNSQEQRIATLLTHASGQQRPSVQIDPILSQVARARAADMAHRHYFAHVNPDGHGPNYLVRQAGYPLPAGYDQSAAGNNIESCAAGDSTPDEAWATWMGSPPHKKHLLAEDPFYAVQTSLGVGYFYDANSDYQYYWVVITAPPPGPSITFANPAANAGVTVPQVAIAGTTLGQPAAAKVVYRLESSDGVGAFISAAGTTSWSATVTGLIAGPNTVRVRSLDGSGNLIKETTRVFRYVVLQPLIVSTEGSGTVTAGFLGTSQRELGATYAIDVKPATGWLFDHWSGSANTNTARLTFVMQEGFSVTANFRVNPFYARKGSYNGLVEPSASATHDASGLLRLSTAVTGAFSAQMSLGSKLYKFKGQFDAAGNAQVTIARGTTLPPLTVTLALDLDGGTDRITGTVSDGTFTADISAGQALVGGSAHFAAGRYTLSLPPNPSDTGATFPKGSGSAILVISKPGAAAVSGTLADGRPFTASAWVSKDGIFPLYVSLFKGLGSLVGRVTINPEATSLDGTVLWTKPERLTDRYYPAAFSTRVSAAGARYTAPSIGTTVIVVPAAQDNSALRLAGGELPSSVMQPATLLPTNAVAIANPQLTSLKLLITPATGRFTGTFIHPVTKAKTGISGVILQDRNAATGFFLGQTTSGPASFAPMQ